MVVDRQQLRSWAIFTVCAVGCIALTHEVAKLYGRVSRSDCSWSATLRTDPTPTLYERQEVMKRSVRKLGADGPLELWDTPRGRYWRLPSADLHQFTWVLAEEDLDIYNTSSLVRSGDTVIDIGADVGLFTRTAINRGASKVVAVEPHPIKCQAIRRTFAREISAGTVVVYPKGVWDKDDTLKLDGITLTSDSGIDVPLTTIDKLVRELGLDRVDLIKMDIEGAEKRAIAGAQETIKRFKPTWTIATEHLVDDHVAIPAALKSTAPYQAQQGVCVGQFSRFQPFTMFFSLRR